MKYIDLFRTTNNKQYGEKKSSGEESDQAYFMVQGNDSLEVNSDIHLDDSASSSRNDYVDTDALNENFPLFVKNC